MKLIEILNKILEGYSDVQGVVSPDGKSIELSIPVKKPVKIKEKVPVVSYIKIKDGNAIKSKLQVPDDGLPIIDKKNQKNYTGSNEYWIKSLTKKTVEKTTFEDIIENHILYFKYDWDLHPKFTIRDSKNKIVGHAIVVDSKDKKSLHIAGVVVDEEYTGRGVANAFYDFIEKTTGKKITRDTGLWSALTPEGERLWKRRYSRQ